MIRLFQNFGIYSYRKRLYSLSRGVSGFQARRKIFLEDRYAASHILLPVLEGRPEAFLTNGDDELLQREWAKEQGLPPSASLSSILLAQIEEHRADVFYTLDPIRYGGAFARRLPGCVKRSVCWQAAPSAGLDLTGCDLVVCNFPSILDGWRAKGLRTAYFAPAHDPVMDDVADNGERPVDVAFVGGYSRHHMERARVLDAVAGLSGEYRIHFGLDRSRLTRLAETPAGLLPPLRRHRRPEAIRRVSLQPVFGRSLYQLFSKAKIVLNGAIDMAGEDRGNMRCFEALGCGALLLSDEGRYPEGFSAGENMVTYRGARDAVAQVTRLLANWKRARPIALAGTQMIRTKYDKPTQWVNFQSLVEAL